MTEVRALNRDAAKQQPEGVFESPLEIVNEILLTNGEKLATLNRRRRSTTRGYAREQLTVLEEIEELRRD